MDKKRIIIAGIFLLVVFGVGYLLYRVFFYRPPSVPTRRTPAAPAAPGEFPEAGAGAERPEAAVPGILPSVPSVSRPAAGVPVPEEKKLITQRVDVSVSSASPGKDGSTNFYNTNDGKFYRLAGDGSVQTLSEKVFFNVQDVTWSPVKTESILEYPDGSNIYYNFETDKQVTLPKHWEDFSFAPAGDKIAAKNVTLAPENRWLISSDPDGKNIKLLEPMGVNQDKVKVDWSPSREVVALSLTGDALGGNRQEVILVGQNRENFKSLVVEGRGLQTQWSPTGRKLLHSVYSARSEYKPELWIVDAKGDGIGENRRLLGLNTWAEKCAMADERFVYCGVPERMDTGAGFAPALSSSVPDKLVKVDTETGFKTEIPLEDFHIIGSIVISGDGSKLLFTDKSEPGLFEIELK